MGLSDSRRQRRSGRSPEQPQRRSRGKSGPCFVIQHHAARSEYYDFRLEIDGVLVSWAIPRGASVNPQDRRMARRTKDHPIDDVEFEDTIISLRGPHSVIGRTLVRGVWWHHAFPVEW